MLCVEVRNLINKC